MKGCPAPAAAPSGNGNEPSRSIHQPGHIYPPAWPRYGMLGPAAVTPRCDDRQMGRRLGDWGLRRDEESRLRSVVR